MERSSPDKKRGELIIRYESDNPPDPDSAVIEFAKQVAKEGSDVTVKFEVDPPETEFFPDPPED